MQTGKNQKIARDMNLLLVLNSIIKEPISRADAAKKHKLSKPVVSDIFAELESLNVISPLGEDVARSARGVKPVNYALNGELGVMIILDMSTPEVKITLLKASGEILAQKAVPEMDKINCENILCFCDRIQELLDLEIAKKYNLCSICVAIPCPVIKNSGEIVWSHRFTINDPDFNLFVLLTNRFKTKVIIKNDVQVMFRAEINAGHLDSNAENAAMLYIDSGIGGAILNNNEIAEGETGRSGEFGYSPVPDKNGKLIMYDDIASINAIKLQIKEAIKAGAKSGLESLKNIHFADIKREYLAGDALTCDIADYGAVSTGTVIAGITKIFDIRYYIISGRIAQLGERFIELVRKTVKEQTDKTFSVIYNSLGEQAVIKGAAVISLNEIISDIIKNR